MKFRFMLKFYIIVTIVTFSYIILNSTYENIYTYKAIKEFKEQCNEVNSSDTNHKYYNVSRETEESAFTRNGGLVNPGAPLDIIIKLESTFDLVVTPFINFFIGGHAAICCDNYKDENISTTTYDLIETTYNNTSTKAEICDKSYWEDLTFTDNYIILRVKNLSSSDKEKSYQKLLSMLGDPYNITFLLNKKKTHYCTDLATKTFKVVGKNTNYDGFVTTVYDLLVSPDVEIVGYKEYNSTNDISSYYGVNISL